ncbi:MAG: tRNA (N6-isopentenyl adenosine(37)-C2)-methylthiotransferase MiaB [Spirochaetes bacterium]|nr:tRNA (N6-isopentenyl adenosine(37)-C2)-methylthiotransferase MiaB [Spirochaetota bacterium]
MKSFYIETYGCQMNKADSISIIENLKRTGFKLVEDNKKADIIIINTCSVRKTAENRIWGRLGFYKNLKIKKDITLLVIGCMAQRIGKSFFLSNHSVDIVVGTFQKNKIPEILKHYKKGERLCFIEEKALDFNQSSPDKENPKKAFVTISYGCNNFCSYCIVPYLRGKERARSSTDIINDINHLVNMGVKQVTLLGQNVNSYGLDNEDISFPILLKKICRETDIKWIKYLSSHPKDFTHQLIDVIANEKKVSNWLHLAVQSGSNNILKKMNRNYKIETYIEKIEKLKNLVPKLNLTTDIIVGFPGETDKDFLDTVNLMKKIEFDDAYMYKYNSRENTFADKEYKDDITNEEKTRRLSFIIDLQRKITRKKKISRLNDTFEVISEKWSKKSNDAILGLTKEDLMIIFKGNKSDFNDIINVKATRLEGNTLYGEKIK